MTLRKILGNTVVLHQRLSTMLLLFLVSYRNKISIILFLSPGSFCGSMRSGDYYIGKPETRQEVMKIVQKAVNLQNYINTNNCIN